jgi:hypothetical protein
MHVQNACHCILDTLLRPVYALLKLEFIVALFQPVYEKNDFTNKFLPGCLWLHTTAHHQIELSQCLV